MGNSTIGKYPKEYNPRIHGPYDPGRYYGKPDTAFGDVKLGEMPAWLGRRNKSFQGAVGLVSRGFHRWSRKGLQARKSTFAPVAQIALAIMVFQIWVRYDGIKFERVSKYH